MRITPEEYERSRLTVVSTWLFRYCIVCRSKIRSEPIWRWKYCEGWDGITAWIYFCMDCCQTPEDVERARPNWAR